MTDLGIRGQKPSQGLEAVDSRSAWSLFDDISWTDFSGGADSFSVPEPDSLERPAWLPARRKEGTKVAKDEAAQFSNRNSMDVDNWDVADLGAVPDNIMTGNSMVKEGTSPEALLDGGLDLGEEDGRNFAFSDVASAGEIGGLFGGENDVDKGGTLLQYAWEALGDMDDIFQNGDSSFAPDPDGLLQWPCSSTSPESNNVAEKTSAELRAMKGKSCEDLKMEFIPCDSFESGREFNSEDDGGGTGSRADVAATELSDKVIDTGGDPVESAAELSGPAKDSKVRLPSESNKHHSAKRQALGRKRIEDRSKKHSQQKRLSEDYTKHQPVYASTQPLQIKPGYSAPISPAMLTMQQRAQPLPYVSSSYGVAHHSPYLLPTPQQASQQVLLGYQHDPHVLKPHYDPETRQKLEVLAPPPASGSNMTPQEKIEKLRWKQKMNRIASEQQMGKQCAQPAKSLEKEAEGKLVDTAVLNQLLGIMSKLDVGTRISIRDALYRLAKNAMYRHDASDGASSSEISSSRPASERNSLSKHIRLPLLETVTNPIDRTIANLLFHKRPATAAATEAPWLQLNSEEAGEAGSGAELVRSVVVKHEPGTTSSDEFWSGQCNTSNMEQ